MDCAKVGRLIYSLRKEKGLTQKQLGDAMNISDKTISKWERGLGCPDVSLLRELSRTLTVDIEKILLGDLSPSDPNGGNMKKLKFYYCPNCHNLLTSVGDAAISCCGRPLAPMVAKPADDAHRLTVETVEDEYYITFSHEMRKAHYLTFIAAVSYDRMLFVRLYPEQSGEVRIPQLHGSKLYFGCSEHGLWINE